MNLFRRHIGRRVAGVGVGVALLMLGLEAPAFATTTVTSFTPTSGPTDCVVVVTGTGFLDFPQAQQDLVFVGPVAGPGDDIVLDGAVAPEWARISATEIWTEVPAGLVLGTSYQIRVDDGTGEGTPSATTFFRTTGAGGCAPTIASFAPNCGSAGATVVLTGTNLIGPGLVGGEVRFSPYAAAQIAAHTVPDVDSPTSLSVVVPSGSGDGRIQVTTFPTTGGTAFSATNFEVPPQDCLVVGPVTHARSVTLSLRKHLVARGAVSVGDDFAECAASVPVKIQRRVSGAWRTVGSTTTTDTGAYKKAIKDKPGKYRARATKVSIGDPVTDICAGAKSPVRRHTH